VNAKRNERCNDGVLAIDSRNKSKKIIATKEILVNYFDVYINTKSIDHALEHFKYLRTHPSYKECINQIEIYNLLLRGVARKGNFFKIQDLWKEMILQGIKPDINSYIALLTTFHAMDPSKNLYKMMFQEIFSEFKNEGHCLESALKTGWFQTTDRHLFIRAIDYFSNESVTNNRNAPYTLPLLNTLSDDPSLLSSQIEGVLTRDQLDNLFSRQSNMELDKHYTIKSIFGDMYNISPQVIEYTETMFDVWRQHLTNKITEDAKRSQKSKGLRLHIFLASVPVKNIVDIILNTARTLCEESEVYSPTIHVLQKTLGEQAMKEYFLQCKLNNPSYLKDFKEMFSKYLDWYCAPQSTSTLTHRAAIQSDQVSQFTWSNETIHMVGNQIKDLLLKELFIQRDQEDNIVVNNQVLIQGKLQSPKYPLKKDPAFFTLFRERKDGRQARELKPHPLLSDLLRDQNMLNIRFKVEHIPMVCPPMPWISHKTGAHFYSHPEIVKNLGYLYSNSISNQYEKLEALVNGEMNPVLDSVNQLGSVPWIINKDVLKLALTIFLEQKDEKLMDVLGLPFHPNNIKDPTKEIQQDNEDGQEQIKEEISRKLEEKEEMMHLKQQSYGLWCDMVYRLSLAQHFKDDVLWFPLFLDFRGRVYPIPPYLNHIGSDLPRSLLIFAKGKPLGKEGFYWLKLHCINLTGKLKKESVARRIEYVDQNIDLILDSAENPLDGKRWWLESDEPWQTLSVCYEIKKAIECAGGPEQYVSHVPIHQDGSCNGLQHYAAIGRDLLGARAVNLVPSDKPQDVYSEIAAIVERKREGDASQGSEIAEILEGYVLRKVVKQTVMTTVYGVTKYGGTKQIAKKLSDISEFPMEHVGEGSRYLSKKTFESLNELFISSQKIQDWLTECAKVISSDCRSNVEWTTPLGMPVEQPYIKKKNHTNAVRNPDVEQRFFARREEKKVVNTLKHRNGFAPNFIHSLDASHMFLTSLHLWRLGINFASVHDCYWTHACDVKEMNRICRQEFVSLHSLPILESLSQSFQDKFLECEDPKLLMQHDKIKEVSPTRLSKLELQQQRHKMLYSNIPEKGSLDLSVVKDSIYFFS